MQLIGPSGEGVPWVRVPWGPGVGRVGVEREAIMLDRAVEGYSHPLGMSAAQPSAPEHFDHVLWHVGMPIPAEDP